MDLNDSRNDSARHNPVCLSRSNSTAFLNRDDVNNYWNAYSRETTRHRVVYISGAEVKSNSTGVCDDNYTKDRKNGTQSASPAWFLITGDVDEHSPANNWGSCLKRKDAGRWNPALLDRHLLRRADRAKSPTKLHCFVNKNGISVSIKTYNPANQGVVLKIKCCQNYLVLSNHRSDRF